MKRLLLISLVIVLACSLILGGCAQQAAAPAPPETPIKIGVMYPLTGPPSIVGGFMVNGAKWAFEEAGNQVAGRKVELIVEDSGGLPDMAVDKAKKLVEHDQVCMVMGPLTQGAKMAVAAYMSKAGVPHLGTHRSPLAMAKYEWSFLVGGSNPQLPYCMGLYAYDEMGLRTVSIIHEDTIDGHSFFGAFKEAFTQKGGQVVQEQYPPFPCNDYASYLINLKDADALVAWVQGAGALLFLTQFHEFGIKERMPLVAGYHGNFVQTFLLQQLPPEVADALIGLSCPADWTHLYENEVNKQFVEAFQKKHGRLPWDFEAKAYSGAKVALEALKATGGDTTPEKLRQAILALKFEVPEGPFRFDPETRCAITDVFIGQIDKVGEEFMLIPVYTYPDVPPQGY